MRIVNDILDLVKIYMVIFFIVCVAMLLFSISFYFGYMNFRYGHFHMEWIDIDGNGNDAVHLLQDSKGCEVLRYRLSDYSNTNQVYTLSLCNGCGRQLFLSKISALVVKKNKYGEIVCSGEFILQEDRHNKGYVSTFFPSSYAPKKNGETIEIELVISKEMKVISKIRFHLKAERVWHWPSV